MKIYQILILFLILCVSGAANVTALPDQPAPVTEKQAIKIARREAAKTDFRSYFLHLKPFIRTDPYALRHSEYYFVDFTPAVYSDFTSYLVVIHKQTGEIIHSGDYYWPSKRPGLDWVFN